MIALLAPGQGSQKPGMLAPWLELAGSRERVERWSELTGLDLVTLGTTAAEDDIKDTAITQPLVVAMGVLAFEHLAKRVELPADIPVAGHSVGELAAAAVAGVLSADDAVRLAAIRGSEMAKACALEPTGMAAVMNGKPGEIEPTLAGFGLTPANVNGAGQIVAAGPIDAIEKLAAEPPAGIRVVVLRVAGAFHTHFMAPAEAALREQAAGVAVNDPNRPLLSNADGEVVTDGAEMLRRLVAQVTLPVRWDLCMDELAATGLTGSVELPPAGPLSGLVKRHLKGTPTLPMKHPDDLDKVAALLTGEDNS